MKPTIDHMPRETQREREHYSAPNSCSLCCICAACEAQKLSVTKRVAFFCQRDKDGEDRWWLDVFGKGDKLRIVPVTNELMMELAHYRREMGLPPFRFRMSRLPCFCPLAASSGRCRWVLSING